MDGRPRYSVTTEAGSNLVEKSFKCAIIIRFPKEGFLFWGALWRSGKTSQSYSADARLALNESVDDARRFDRNYETIDRA